jgi:hypothetical protein
MANFWELQDIFQKLQELLFNEEQDAGYYFNLDGRPAETNPFTEQWSYRYLALNCVNRAFIQFNLLLAPAHLPFDQRLGAVQQSLRNSITRDPDCLNIGVSADAGLLLNAILSA